MSRYSLDEFVAQTAQRPDRSEPFELESDRMLEVNLQGMVWTKMGSMVAYAGGIKFTREGIMEHGQPGLFGPSFPDGNMSERVHYLDDFDFIGTPRGAGLAGSAQPVCLAIQYTVFQSQLYHS